MLKQIQPEHIVALVVIIACSILLGLGKDGAIKTVFLAMVTYLLHSLRDHKEGHHKKRKNRRL